jgi:hypothetical protein
MGSLLTNPVPTVNQLLVDVHQLVNAARQRVAGAVNAELTRSRNGVSTPPF